MTLALLAIGDGRHEYEARALASALEHLPRFDHYVFVDDSDHALGFGGAIRDGWGRLPADTDFVFHLELDFVFVKPPPVLRMAALIDRHPRLAQVALKRQPWNPQEKAAGGIVELHPQDFRANADSRAVWTEHRRFFTTNPSVYPRWITRYAWPDGGQSEGMFTHALLASDPALRFAFWGDKYDAPMVEHIGNERAGNGY